MALKRLTISGCDAGVVAKVGRQLDIQQVHLKAKQVCRRMVLRESFGDAGKLLAVQIAHQFAYRRRLHDPPQLGVMIADVTPDGA